MSLTIGPDLGDTITIEDQGVRWTVTYPFIDNSVDGDGNFLFNNGEKAVMEAQFPRDFTEINPDGLEGAMMELAKAVARGKNIHGQ